jgi:hypothetical protein
VPLILSRSKQTPQILTNGNPKNLSPSRPNPKASPGKKNFGGKKKFPDSTHNKENNFLGDRSGLGEGEGKGKGKIFGKEGNYEVLEYNKFENFKKKHEMKFENVNSIFVTNFIGKMLKELSKEGLVYSLRVSVGDEDIEKYERLTKDWIEKAEKSQFLIQSDYSEFCNRSNKILEKFQVPNATNIKRTSFYTDNASVVDTPAEKVTNIKRTSFYTDNASVVDTPAKRNTQTSWLEPQKSENLLTEAKTFESVRAKYEVDPKPTVNLNIGLELTETKQEGSPIESETAECLEKDVYNSPVVDLGAGRKWYTPSLPMRKSNELSRSKSPQEEILVKEKSIEELGTDFVSKDSENP